MSIDLKNQEITAKIATQMRGVVDSDSLTYVVAELAYVMFKLEGEILTDRQQFIDFVNRLDCSLSLKDSLLKDISPFWQSIRLYNGIYSSGDYAGVIDVCANHAEVDNYGVPQSLLPLVVRVLSNEPGGLMADLACGRGTVIAEALREDDDLQADGVDVNEKASSFAEMEVAPFGGRARVKQGEAFQWVIERFAHYDKVFCYPPFGLRAERGAQMEAFQRLFPMLSPKIGMGTQSELMFALAAIYSLKETGRAVLLLPDGTLSNQGSGAIAVREFMVEQGYLDCVISLPERMLERTGIDVSILVLSRRENRQSVTMIDASELGIKGRRFNTLDADGIEKIVNAVYGFSDHSNWGVEHRKRVEFNEIRSNDYVLSAKYYFNRSQLPRFADGVKFRELIKDIARGANVGSRDLDSLVAHEDGVCYYLSPGNILGGRIADDLTGMKEIPKGAITCEMGDLVLLRIGTPNKVAVFEDVFNKPVVPSSNLFICRLDQTKVNPWYLKSFFESADGERTLASIAVGTAIKSISRKALEEIMVPCPPLGRQNEIAMAYQEKLREITEMEQRLYQLKGELASIYDSAKEDN